MEEKQKLYLVNKGVLKEAFTFVRNFSESIFFIFFVFLFFTSNSFAIEEVDLLRASSPFPSPVTNNEGKNSSLKRVNSVADLSFKQDEIILRNRESYVEDAKKIALSLSRNSAPEDKGDSIQLVEVKKLPSFSQETDSHSELSQGRGEDTSKRGTEVQSNINGALHTVNDEKSIKNIQKQIDKEKIVVENLVREKEQTQNKQHISSASEETKRAVGRISAIIEEKEDSRSINTKVNGKEKKEPVSKPVHLFNTIDLFRKPVEGHASKWERVVNLEKKKKPIFGSGAKERMPANIYKRWIVLRGKVENLSDFEKAKAINRFFNQWPYKTDMELWGVEDYWEDPEEFLKKSGDCTDYAITKYYALRALGVPAEKMRIVALIDKIRGIGHAVLAFYHNDTAYILDNTTPLFLEHTKFSHYDPKYSVNETYRWGHAKILGKISK